VLAGSRALFVGRLMLGRRAYTGSLRASARRGRPRHACGRALANSVWAAIADTPATAAPVTASTPSGFAGRDHDERDERRYSDQTRLGPFVAMRHPESKRDAFSSARATWCIDGRG